MMLRAKFTGACSTAGDTRGPRPQRGARPSQVAAVPGAGTRPRVLAAVLGLVVCATACDSTPTPIAPSDPAAPEAAGERYDGVLIYRAVFFGKGELVRVLPSPWRDGGRRTSAHNDARADRLEAAILEWVEASDPTFFTGFSTAMRSGDHLRVERMLARSSTLTERALRSVADESTAITLERVTLGEDTTGTCVVIAVVYAAVAVKVKLWVSGNERAQDAASSLSRDEVVHALATSLSPAAPVVDTAGRRVAP